MDIVVALWLVFSAFILGANTGNPEIASMDMEDLIATPEEQPLTEADPDVPNGESAQGHACSSKPHDVIYRDLTRPRVSHSE